MSLLLLLRSPAATTQAPAGTASGSVTAPAAQGGVGARPAEASGTVDAAAAFTGVLVNAGAAPGDVLAYPPTVDAAGSTHANAGAALSTAAAHGAAAAVAYAAPAGTASGSVTAYDTSAALGWLTSVATAGASAGDLEGGLGVRPGEAPGGVQAFGPELRIAVGAGAVEVAGAAPDAATRLPQVAFRKDVAAREPLSALAGRAASGNRSGLQPVPSVSGREPRADTSG